MNKKFILGLSTAALTIFTAASSSAATVGYVSNPSTNSSDFAIGAAGIGGTINNNVNFNAMSLGALDGSFYSGSDGVTIVSSGAVNGVTNTAISQTNTGGSIAGEGVHANSNFLSLGATVSSLTFNFASTVYGAGLFTNDVWSNGGLRIEAFSGLNGTGSSLGAFSGVTSNFQQDGLYFMGLTSDAGFRSFVFSDTSNNGGDIFGVDDFQFVTASNVSPVPVPAALPLLLVALGGLGIAGRRRKAA